MLQYLVYGKVTIWLQKLWVFEMPFVDMDLEARIKSFEGAATDEMVASRTYTGKDYERRHLLAVAILSDMEKEGRTLAVVSRPYAYHHDLLQKRIEIPSGFITDFASIPSALWVFVQPFGRHAAAAVVHDYLYALKQEGTRKQADFIFRAAMAENGVSFLRRNLMYFAVRLFGGKPFNNNQDWRFVDTEFGDPVEPPLDKIKNIHWRPWKLYRKGRKIRDARQRAQFWAEYGNTA